MVGIFSYELETHLSRVPLIRMIKALLAKSLRVVQMCWAVRGEITQRKYYMEVLVIAWPPCSAILTLSLTFWCQSALPLEWDAARL